MAALVELLGGADVVAVAHLHFAGGLTIEQAGAIHGLARTTAHRKVKLLHQRLGTLGLVPHNWKRRTPGRQPKPKVQRLGGFIPRERDKAGDCVEESNE